MLFRSWTDSFSDDTRLDTTQSSESGEYTLATHVRLGGCFTDSSQYYLKVVVTGLVYRATGEPRTWGGSESITCDSKQVVDIEVEVPDWLMRPEPN